MSPFVAVGILAAGLSPFLLRWLFRRALEEQSQHDAPDATLHMRPSLASRQMIVGSALLGLLSTVALFYYTLPYWQLGAIFCPFLLTIFILPLPSLWRRVVVSDLGVEVRSPWVGSKFIQWKQIASLSFRQWGQTIFIHSVDGIRLAFPCTLSGMGDFERRLALHLTREKYERAFADFRHYLAAL